MEQSSGRSWDFVGISREGWGLRDGTLPNKKKNTSKQEKTPPNKVNQGKTKVTQSKSKNPKRNQGKTNGDQGEPRKNEVK